VSKKVFISYRREDTAPSAGRVYDRLSRLLSKPNVFFDVSTIGGGEDFKEKIVSAIGRSDAALIFIGREWLAPVQPAGKARIWEASDYVRTELRAALARPILVLPVLVAGAQMPQPEQLPEDVKAITTKNALPLRHESFDDDAENIVATVLGVSGKERPWENKGTLWSKIAYGIGGAIVALAVVVAVALVHFWILDRSLSESIG
jgi:TIR domain